MSRITTFFLLVFALLMGGTTTVHAQAPGSFTCRFSNGHCSIASQSCNQGAGYAASLKVCRDMEFLGQTFCDASGPQTCVTNPPPVPGSGSTTVDVQGNCSTNYISTAIGCIPIGDLGSFASFFLKWGLGFAGGLAILMLIYSSFMIMTSAGDPKRLQTGKELLFSVVSGIILLVFSMFILRILGVNILGLI